MNQTNLAALVLAVAIAFAGGVYVLVHYTAQKPLGNVITQGILPKVSSQAVKQVGPQQILTLSASTTNCTSRVISTGSTTVMLAFADGFTPTVQQGSFQAGSTTVSYDNANFGCGKITAYGSATGTVTVTTLTQ